MPLKRLLQVKVITGSDASTLESNIQDWLDEQNEQQFVSSEFQIAPDGTYVERIYYTE